MDNLAEELHTPHRLYPAGPDAPPSTLAHQPVTPGTAYPRYFGSSLSPDTKASTFHISNDASQQASTKHSAPPSPAAPLVVSPNQADSSV